MRTFLITAAIFASLCLLFLTITLPWLAIQTWADTLSRTTASPIAVRNAIAATVLGLAILFLDVKLGRWAFDVLTKTKKK